MPNNLIYVQENGAADFSRWLSLSARPEGSIVLHLADLCHPGRSTSLDAVTADVITVSEALDGGVFQISAKRGYVLLSGCGPHLTIEFKGLDDSQATKVVVLAEEVRSRIQGLAELAKAQSSLA